VRKENIKYILTRQVVNVRAGLIYVRLLSIGRIFCI